MSNAIKVGVFAAVVLAVLAVLILRVEDIELFGPEGQRIDALFDSVAGLDDKAAVRVAGVRVGRVDGVGLAGARARVTLLLEAPVSLTVGSRAAIASTGLLGDKYVELIPGPSEAPPLPPGSVLEGETPVSLDQAIGRIDAVGANIEKITGSLAGTGEDNQIARLLGNLEAVSADIRDLIAANRDEVSATIENFESASATLARELPRLAERMAEVLSEVQGVVAENREDLAASLDNIRRLTAGLEPAVADLRTISGRLAAGEGTIGKLLASDEAHDKLVATLGSIESGVEGLSETLGAVRQFQLDLEMEGFYLSELEEGQASLAVDLKTRSPWLYRVGVVDPARGRESTKLQRITTTLPDGTVETRTIETLTQEDDLGITALLGSRLARDLTVRTGLIESSFGLAVEYPLFDRRLWLALDAFDFDREDELAPHLRLGARWRFHPNLYLLGGYDDFLEPEQDSFFLGGGIRWRDDDLKYLLGSVPRF
jgi:phospholipid/cholesterol/gamma-HCH transport system substrate-binding protein